MDENEPFPCEGCGHDVRAQADGSAVDGTFEFRCPQCGLVDHI